MAAYRVTFFFESQQSVDFGAGASVGWTESWYMELGGSIDSVFTHPDVLQWIALRKVFLMDIYRISFLRVSLDTTNGITRGVGMVKIQTILGGVGAIKSTGITITGKLAAQVQCALLFDMQRIPRVLDGTEPVHHRRMLLRGLSQRLIAGNVVSRTAPEWNDILAFMNYVANKQTGEVNPAPGPHVVFMGTRFFNPTNRPVPINAIITDPAQTATIDVAPDFPADGPGTRYVIYGQKYYQPFNRTWTLIDHLGAPGTLLHLGTARRPLVEGVRFPGDGKAKIRKLSWSYGTFDQWSFIGLRNKSTGGIFHRLRGRKPNR